MAKFFDKDEDGILNEKEKAEAMEAIKNGFEGNFVWGLEQSGPAVNRVMQKRGQVIAGEDWTQVEKSYPKHPLSQADRRHYNKKDMLEKRRKQDVAHLTAQKAAYDQQNPLYVEQPKIQ